METIEFLMFPAVCSASRGSDPETRISTCSTKKTHRSMSLNQNNAQTDVFRTENAQIDDFLHSTRKSRFFNPKHAQDQGVSSESRPSASMTGHWNLTGVLPGDCNRVTGGLCITRKIGKLV